jgi:hypothetical protein
MLTIHLRSQGQENEGDMMVLMMMLLNDRPQRSLYFATNIDHE